MTTTFVTIATTTIADYASVTLRTTILHQRQHRKNVLEPPRLTLTIADITKSLRTNGSNLCLTRPGITKSANVDGNDDPDYDTIVKYIASDLIDGMATPMHITVMTNIPFPYATNYSCRAEDTSTDEQYALRNAVSTVPSLTIGGISDEWGKLCSFAIYLRINILRSKGLVIRPWCCMSGCHSAEPEPPVMNGTLSGALSTASDGSKAPSLASQPAVVGMLSGAMRAASDESQALSPASPTPPVVKVMWKAKGLEATSDNAGDDVMIMIVNVSEGCMFLSYEYRLAFFFLS